MTPHPQGRINKTVIEENVLSSEIEFLSMHSEVRSLKWGLAHVLSHSDGERCTVYMMIIVYFKLYNTLRLLYLGARSLARRTQTGTSASGVRADHRLRKRTHI